MLTKGKTPRNRSIIPLKCCYCGDNVNESNWELRHLKAFVTVARLSSFTRAARLLHVSQPALTKQIAYLEDAIGARLFDRTSRTVALTALGRELVPAVERILGDLESLMDTSKEWSGGIRGTLSIACLPSIGASFLPETISRFVQQYPAITVRVRDVLAQLVVELVRSGEADFGLGTHEADHPELQFVPLIADAICAAFPPGHPLERQKTISLKALAQNKLVVTEPRSSVRRLIDRAFETVGHLNVPAYEAAYVPTVLAMAKAGLGVAIVPSTMVPADSECLIARRIAHPSLTREVGIISRTGSSLPVSAQRFIAVLRATVKASKGRGTGAG